MKYQVFTAPIHLQGLVQCFWSLESSRDETTPHDYFLMADNCPEIIFQYNEGFKNYSAQSARMRFQHSVHNRFDVGKRIGFFGVRLYPHAVNQLLHMPATEVVNQVFDFSDLFKPEGSELADQVYNETTTAGRIARVSAFLSKKAFCFKVDPIVHFVDHVVKRSGRVDLPGMQQASGLSVKQFERRFKAIAGFPPKYFARIARFQSVKDRYCTGGFPTLTSLAYSCNYYDQSHFNREFKEFAGVHPLKYLKPIGLGKTKSAGDPGNAVLMETGPHKFDGYLPCGWFV
ncbi:MAG TPA: helix-turn-helix domain-containing protein [Puia sp.]|jgi:AraC-like DNA-binding protein